MLKLSRSFFTGNEVLFVGYSAKKNPHNSGVYKAFIDNGLTVYPLNNNVSGKYDIKVYHNLQELPQVPHCAYLLVNKENARQLLEPLAAKGVKRILFQNRRYVDDNILNTCRELGMETAIGCPLMVFGSGLHRVHGFFAGVK